MTVRVTQDDRCEEQFLKLHPDIPALDAVRGDAKFLGQKVGNMKPDLIAFDPVSGQALVFDLVPKRDAAHFKKTVFYEKVLSHTADVLYVRVAETYYNDPALAKATAAVP